MSAWVFKLWFIICGAAETYFAKREKRDRPAGRSRSHDVLKQENLRNRVQKFGPCPTKKENTWAGHLVDGVPGGENPGPQEIVSLRREGETPGREFSLSGRAGRRKPGTQFRKTFCPAREEKALAENSGELSVTGPAGGENPQNSVARPTETIPAATARVRALNVPPSCCCSYDSILPIRCQLPFSKFIQVIHIYKIKRPALQEFAISSKSRQNLSHDGYAYANRAEISSASVITTGVSSPTNRMDTLSIAAVTMEPFTHASFQKCFAGVV